MYKQVICNNLKKKIFFCINILYILNALYFFFNLEVLKISDFDISGGGGGQNNNCLRKNIRCGKYPPCIHIFSQNYFS